MAIVAGEPPKQNQPAEGPRTQPSVPVPPVSDTYDAQAVKDAAAIDRAYGK